MLNNLTYLTSLFMGLLNYIFDIFSIGSGRVRVVLTVFASINVWTESLRIYHIYEQLIKIYSAEINIFTMLANLSTTLLFCRFFNVMHNYCYNLKIIFKLTIYEQVQFKCWLLTKNCYGQSYHYLWNGISVPQQGLHSSHKAPGLYCSPL